MLLSRVCLFPGGGGGKGGEWPRADFPEERLVIEPIKSFLQLKEYKSSYNTYASSQKYYY